MIRQGMTVRDATERWVNQFNAIPTGMIEKLMRCDRDEWREITLPSRGDRVYVSEFPYGNALPEHFGEIIHFHKESGLYSVRFDSGLIASLTENDLAVTYDDLLPMWGTMWSFAERPDDDWLASYEALRAMSDCGFRIFESDEFGYFFGIDGAGYDFYAEHWTPLYRARGLEWHDPKAEKEYQMRNKGYRRGKLGGKEVWLDAQDNVIEEVR